MIFGLSFANGASKIVDAYRCPDMVAKAWEKMAAEQQSLGVKPQ
jgi:hypothetical protein